MKELEVKGVSMARQVELYRAAKGSDAVARQMELRRRELIRRRGAKKA